MELRAAERIASELLTILRPSCEQIEIAGSIRRRKPEVKDIELLAVARFGDRQRPGALFAEPVNLLHWNTDQLTASPRSTFQRGDKWGSKYRKLLYLGGREDIAVDLFIVEDVAWGPQLTIRTGPAEFSKRLVSPEPWGCMPAGWKLEGGKLVNIETGLWRGPVWNEGEFFEFLNCPQWAPHERTEARLAQFLDCPAAAVH